MGYLKIANLYKEQDVLLFKELYALEKIHGTHAHISWNEGNLRFFTGESHPLFVSLFDQEKLKASFTEQFGAQFKVVVYGEHYGKKCQGMGNVYGRDSRFVCFDIKIEHNWLCVPDAEQVAANLGLEFVHYVRIPAELGAIDAQRDSFSVQAERNGMGSDKPREGIVLRPLIEVTKNNGDRIIAKHKNEAYKERRNVPKVDDPDKLTVLTKAREIANEWVVPNRLEHVLQKHPEVVGIEHTKQLIMAMIEDIYLEAKGEIVESKEVAVAIGTKTAQLWKKRLNNVH